MSAVQFRMLPANLVGDDLSKDANGSTSLIFGADMLSTSGCCENEPIVGPIVTGGDITSSSSIIEPDIMGVVNVGSISYSI